MNKAKQILILIVLALFALSTLAMPQVGGARQASSVLSPVAFRPTPFHRTGKPDQAPGSCTSSGSTGCQMGIADYGCSDSTCSTTDAYNATEVSSWANFTTALNIGAATPSGDGLCNSGCLSIQQNAVIQGAYDHGGAASKSSPTGIYWLQNVPFVSCVTSGCPSGGSYKITVEDNVWNFTTPTAILKGAVYGNLLGDCSSSGKFAGDPAYFCVAKQSFTTTLPFEIRMTEITGSFGSVLSRGTSEAEFLLSVYHSGTLLTGGSFAYDLVAFNGIGYHWPNFHVGGTTPVVNDEFFYYDYATDIIGPGGSTNVALTSITAKLTEFYAPSTLGVYKAIPNAYSVGYDTAETSTNVHVTSTTVGVVKGAAVSAGTDNFAFLF
jgi:Thermopsin